MFVLKQIIVITISSVINRTFFMCLYCTLFPINKKQIEINLVGNVRSNRKLFREIHTTQCTIPFGRKIADVAEVGGGGGGEKEEKRIHSFIIYLFRYSAFYIYQNHPIFASVFLSVVAGDVMLISVDLSVSPVSIHFNRNGELNLSIYFSFRIYFQSI